MIKSRFGRDDTHDVGAREKISGSGRQAYDLDSNDSKLHGGSRAGNQRWGDNSEQMIIDSGRYEPNESDRQQQPVFQNQIFGLDNDHKASFGKATINGRVSPSQHKIFSPENDVTPEPKRMQKADDLMFAHESQSRLQPTKTFRLGIEDLISSSKNTANPLDFYEKLEHKSDLLLEEMTKQINNLKNVETMPNEFEKETKKLKNQMYQSLEYVKTNLGLNNLKEISSTVFTEIEELSKNCVPYKKKAEEARQILKTLRNTFPASTQRYSIIPNIDKKIESLISVISKEQLAMTRFVDNFKLQVKKEPFSQKTRDAAQDLLQRMQKYEPTFNENQKEIEIIFASQADILEEEAKTIEQEAVMFLESVEKINEGRAQLLEAAALEKPLRLMDDEIKDTMNQMKNLFEVTDHPRFPRCPTLAKKRGFDNLVYTLVQKGEQEHAKIQRVKTHMKNLIDSERGKSLYFQNQKYQIRDTIDLRIRELEDHLDTNKNLLNMVKKIEKEEAEILNHYAFSKELNYETAAAAAESMFRKFAQSDIPPGEQDLKEINKLAANFNMLQAEFKTIKSRLDKLNLPRFRGVLGNVFSAFNEKIDVIIQLCAQKVDQLLSLKVADSNVVSEIENLSIEKELEGYERYLDRVTNDLSTLDYNLADDRENDRKKLESILKKKNSQLQESLRKCRNEEIKKRYKFLVEKLKSSINEIEILGEIIESGMHIVDVLRETNTPDIYGNPRIKVMLTDKTDRLRQITHRLERILADRTVELNLGVLPKFTINQNQVFIDIFDRLLDHFNKEIPYVLKNDPSNIEQYHLKFKKNLKTDLDRVDKVNLRAVNALNGLTKIWQKGLSEVKPHKDDPNILLKSYTNAMQDIFNTSFIYQIAEYSVMIPKINFLLDEIEASSIDSTKKKQMQSELQFIQTVFGKVNEKLFKEFLLISNPLSEGGSHAATQVKQRIQQVYTVLDDTLNPHDAKLSTSEYFGKLTNWKSMLLSLLENLKQYANSIVQATTVLEAKTSEPTLNFLSVLKALSEFSTTVEKSAKECLQKCSKYKIEQSWLCPKPEEFKLIKDFSANLESFENAKGRLKLLLTKARDNFASASKEELNLVCAKAIESLNSLQEIVTSRWLEQAFRTGLQNRFSSFDTLKNNVPNWRQAIKDLSLEIGNWQMGKSDKSSELSLINSMINNIEENMSY